MSRYSCSPPSKGTRSCKLRRASYAGLKAPNAAISFPLSYKSRRPCRRVRGVSHASETRSMWYRNRESRLDQRYGLSSKANIVWLSEEDGFSRAAALAATDTEIHRYYWGLIFASLAPCS